MKLKIVDNTAITSSTPLSGEVKNKDLMLAFMWMSCDMYHPPKHSSLMARILLSQKYPEIL